MSGLPSVLTWRKQLESIGLRNRPNKAASLMEDMVEVMWEKGFLGGCDAKTLQNT